MQNDQKARVRGLESQVRELQGRLGQAEGHGESAQLSQALLAQRIQELEAALTASRRAEQEHAAQLARAEGRAAVAEGSLRARAEQLGQGLGELQAQHAATLAAQREQHARELAAQRERQEAAAAAAQAATAAAQADWEARLQELASSKAGLEAAVRREQQRVKELQGQLDKEGSKHEAVRELMRHSEALQGQVDRLQAAAQEERRRLGKAAQAAEAAVQQERQLADAAAQEAQQRAQVGRSGLGCACSCATAGCRCGRHGPLHACLGVSCGHSAAYTPYAMPSSLLFAVSSCLLACPAGGGP